LRKMQILPPPPHNKLSTNIARKKRIARVIIELSIMSRMQKTGS
jgi:hypothetical protein